MAVVLSEFDVDIRRRVYDDVIREGIVPTKSALASKGGVALGDVTAALTRLADAHMLVLQRDSGEILMANPFSAVPTPFLVTITERSWYGNCIWDAMGIAAMLHSNATIAASCGCCGTAMELDVPNGCQDDDERVAHFAIPAARWWDDIVFN